MKKLILSCLLLSVGILMQNCKPEAGPVGPAGATGATGPAGLRVQRGLRVQLELQVPQGLLVQLALPMSFILTGQPSLLQVQALLGQEK